MKRTVTCFVFMAAALSGGVTYTLTDLGANSQAAAISSSGYVVGTTGQNNDLFFWDGSAMKDLGTLGMGWVTGVNSSGQIVGSTNVFDPNMPGGFGNSVAFITDPSNGFRRAIDGLPQQSNLSQATAISDSGNVTGWSQNGLMHAFLYSGGNLLNLSTTLPPNYSTAGSGVNDAGTVVGTGTDGSGRTGWFTYKDGTMNFWSQNITPLAVTSSSQIVGSIGISGYQYPFYSEQNGDLRYLPGYSGGTAIGIDSSGDVLGNYSGGPFVYFQDGINMALSALVSNLGGLTLTNAAGINPSGQIAATAVDQNNVAHAILLNPVSGSKTPEPATFTTLGMALVVLATMRRRRTKGEIQ